MFDHLINDFYSKVIRCNLGEEKIIRNARPTESTRFVLFLMSELQTLILLSNSLVLVL